MTANIIDFSSSFGSPSLVGNKNGAFINSFNEGNNSTLYRQINDEESFISQSFAQQQVNRSQTPISQLFFQHPVPPMSKADINIAQINQFQDYPHDKQQKLNDSPNIQGLNNSVISFKKKKSIAQTEPNSPTQQNYQTNNHFISSQQKLLKFNQASHSNAIDQKELNLRLSQKKLDRSKQSVQGLIDINQKITPRKQKKSKHMKKFGNNSAQYADQFDCLTPSSENSSQKNKNNSSFLPKLEKRGKDINSQVLHLDQLSLIPLNDIRFVDHKERKLELQSPSNQNNSIILNRDSIHFDKKKDTNFERKKQTSLHLQNLEIQNVITPGRSGVVLQKHSTAKQEPQYHTKSTQQSNNYQQTMPQFSPQIVLSSNNKDLSGYSGNYEEYRRHKKGFTSDSINNKNINKLYPIFEIKNIINEQIIRTKLNRGTTTTSNSGVVGINRFQHQPDQYYCVPQSEVVSPNQSPLHYNIQEYSKLKERENINKSSEPLNITLQNFFQQRSGSSSNNNNIGSSNAKDYFNSNDKAGLSHFHQRTGSVVQSEKFKLENITTSNHSIQFSTIEQVLNKNLPFTNQPQPQKNINESNGSINNNNSQNGGGKVVIQTGAEQQQLILQKHQIKTLTSKNMPICFRMNKYQLKQKQKGESKESSNQSGIVNNGNDEGKIYSKINQRSLSNDKKYINSIDVEKQHERIENKANTNKNEYSKQNATTSAGSGAGLSSIFLNNRFNNSNEKTAGQMQNGVISNDGGNQDTINSRKYAVGFSQEIYKELIVETDEEDKMRMTPAFNERVKESFNLVQRTIQ